MCQREKMKKRTNNKPEIDWLQCHCPEGILDDQVTKMQTSTVQKQQSIRVKNKATSQLINEESFRYFIKDCIITIENKMTKKVKSFCSSDRNDSIYKLTFANSSSGTCSFFCILTLTSAKGSSSRITKKNGSPKF